MTAPQRFSWWAPSAPADYWGRPAYILSVGAGLGGRVERVRGERGALHLEPAFILRSSSGCGRAPESTAADVDVAQVYENFTGPAVASMIDHGLCPPGPAAGEFMTVENLTVERGSLPINTAGGDIAEGFVHGIGLVAEAVRQIRGDSPNPVADADISLLIGGPMAPLVSSTVFGSPATV